MKPGFYSEMSDISINSQKKFNSLNGAILQAEKNSLLTALLIGLISGLITYFITPTFPIMHSLVVGIGSLAISSIILFYFLFGKDLAKRTIDSNEYGSPLSFYTPSSENIAIQSYNLAHGNPAADFIMPEND